MFRPLTKTPRLVVVVLCASGLTGCGSSAPPSSAAAVPAPPGPTMSATPAAPDRLNATATAAGTPADRRVVVVGDSIAQASSCQGCQPFGEIYAAAMATALRTHVAFDDRAAIQLSNLPAVQASQLLNDLLRDGALRSAVADADVVIVNVGFNDTPWNRLDNPCDASDPTATVVDWSRLTDACVERVTGEYKQTLDELMTQLDGLRGCWTPPGETSSCAQRGHRDTLLRLTTVYDDWIGEGDTSADKPTGRADQAFVEAQCWVVREHGGDCVDVFHLLNGARGDQDAASYLTPDHTHLNQHGHQAVADALVKLGFAPLR